MLVLRSLCGYTELVQFGNNSFSFFLLHISEQFSIAEYDVQIFDSASLEKNFGNKFSYM